MLALRGVINRSTQSSIFLQARRSMSSQFPVQRSIEFKLDTLQPSHIEVINESNMHNVPKNSETHFKVIMVSAAFEGKALIQRHRLINGLLQEELDGPVHALSLQLKTPNEWEASGGMTTPSPACRGGSKH